MALENAFEDDFADLLEEDFDELERRAISSTQAPPLNQPGNLAGHDLRAYEQEFDQDYADEGDDVVVDESYGQYPKTPANAIRPHRNALDSGALWRSETRDASAATTRGTTHLPYRASSQAQEAGGQRGASGGTPDGEVEDETDVSKLQAQIRDLLTERERLNAAVRDATRQVFTKSGEITIVRANNERVLREKEQKIADLERELKASNNERLVEQEQARKQQEQLATENRFNDHDKILARARHRKQPPRQEQDVIVTARQPRARPSEAQTTPKKGRHATGGDGFGVHERSPAHSLPRSRDGTPTAAEKKRKRALESPSRSEFLVDEDYEDHGAHLEEDVHDLEVSFPAESAVSAADTRYGMIQTFLDHRFEWGERRTIEILADFRLPSSGDSTLSSMVFDAIATLDSTQPELNFAVSICSIVIVLWDKCIAEKYHAPLKYFINQVSFFLDEYSDIAGSLVDELVPLLQTTSDINVVARFKRHRRGASTQNSDLPISNEVSVTSCLDMLLQIVSSFDSRESPSPGRFWRLIRFDFVSMLLRPSQDPKDITLLARLLSYSSHADSVGSIIDPSRTRQSQDQSNFDQAKSEGHLLDRISSMLVETPRSVDDDSEEYSDQMLCNMRLALLDCLASYANRPHTATSIAQHPLVIGRLVRCMADGYHSARQSSPGDGMVLRSHLAVVSEATRLVYYLLDAYKSVDIHEKLARIPGGAHRYLVALSQLVFSEGNLYDIEIEEGVIDCAQSLLEDYVSPEEADQLMEMASADRRFSYSRAHYRRHHLDFECSIHTTVW